MSRGKDGPEDVDATFAEIVADLRAEGVGLLDEEPEPAEPEEKKAPDRGWRGGGAEWDATMFGDDPADDNEHYVPPEPPPLPRPRKGAFIVLLFFVIGLVLLIWPNVLGLGTTLATPLGILSLATAIALLLLRVRQGPPDGADPTTGAQV
ncbi:hypothetical protein AB5J62_28055 [Amycolatopsis sp. cg5]|uniref:hypothetical protein n=1 Tax=Amycolatopsis sp. cg5 TaxID=3238802 RepID=UPI0035268427